MMMFEYFEPGERVRDLIGSYYAITVPEALEDVMRAEIANVRFILEGRVHSDISGVMEVYSPGDAILCGPTFKWSAVRFEDHTRVVGAAITPLGWARMFEVPASDYADRVVPLKSLMPEKVHGLIDRIFDPATEGTRGAVADVAFAALDNPDARVNQDFLDIVTEWITDPDANELEDLLAAIDLSPRQVERLSKLYFGSAPKKLHRKFRALHSANRLTWQAMDDWRDVATTAYYDQSHFIREFKEFNGRTPSEFINGAHLLVRQTLTERRQIKHHSPYSLVG
ncbi:helix-turn-helix domain-containing protein [Henriciella marina]|uniref:helix-turn-helix domain-containing protein n=1 Tax=Henriciella marina TaxID=453851 RepID=UPI00037AC0DE|nr:helix-turn-helix domain-containing protein [Henriciella marina]